jgi:hypothetical protein
VSIEVTPSPLQLGPREKATVVLSVRNDASQPITNVRVDLIPEQGVDLQPVTAQADQVSAGGSVAWTVEVMRTSDVSVPNASPVKVTYQQAGPSGSVQGVATGTIPLQDRAVKAATDIVDMRLQTSLTELQGGREGVLYVVLRDVTAFPVTLTGLEIRSPRFLKVLAHEGECPGSKSVPTDSDQLLKCDMRSNLAAQQTLVIPFTVRAEQAVEPGPHIIVVLANLTWTAGGQSQPGSVTSSVQIGASVMGESQILTLMGLPSLFLLPGFLAVTIFRLLWKNLRPKGEFSLIQPSAPEFWLIAISLSLIAVLIVYPFVSPGRHIGLGVYSLSDIATVWIGSLAVGSLVWFVSQVPGTLRRIMTVPTIGDSPTTVLRKLDRNHWDLDRQFAQVSFDGRSEGAFVVYREPGQAEVWVSPPIVVERGGLPSEISDKLTTALGSKSAKQVGDVFRDAERKGYTVCSWKREGTRLTGPTPVTASSVGAQGVEIRLIVEDAGP